jgi:hypothetical protein
LGNSSLSIDGVNPEGTLDLYSSPCVCPQTFSSSTGRPTARTNTRTDMLLTLGGSMLSFMDTTDLPG